MEALIKTRKIGGSLVITIPRVIVEEEGLMPNQIVEINVKKIKKSGFGIAYVNGRNRFPSPAAKINAFISIRTP